MEIDILLDEGAKMPSKAHDIDAGFDIYTPYEFMLPAGGSTVVRTKTHMIIPPNYCGLVVSKSGLNTRYNIESTGLVDANYTGEIVIKLQNHGDRDFHFHKGEKITQIIILPVPEVTLHTIDSLPDTERGANGFGSSGRY